MMAANSTLTSLPQVVGIPTQASFLEGVKDLSVMIGTLPEISLLTKNNAIGAEQKDMFKKNVEPLHIWLNYIKRL